MFVYNVIHYLLGKENSASLTRFYDCSLIWIFTLVVMRVYLAGDTGTVKLHGFNGSLKLNLLLANPSHIYGQIYNLHLPT